MRIRASDLNMKPTMQAFAVEDFWCWHPICQVMDASPHRGCRKPPQHASCLWWVWYLCKNPWLQFIFSGQLHQFSVRHSHKLHQEGRERQWKCSVAAISWGDRFHGQWVCDRSFKVPFNLKHHISSVHQTQDLQLPVFLEMPLGLQEASFGDCSLPWWALSTT